VPYLVEFAGIMSEAELHVLRGRLLRGKRNKAERGELFSHPPVGYVRLPSGELDFDPDERVQGVVRMVFAKFTELGSVRQVLLYLAQHAVLLPIRPHHGPDRGQLQWRVPVPATVYNILRHPLYAGAYCYGRSQVDPRRKVPGRRHTGRVRLADDHWQVLLRDRVPAYIEWDQYLINRDRLHANRSSFETPGTPRSGAALLGGLVACARCGWRMYVHYRDKPEAPRYVCRRNDPTMSQEARCPSLSARAIDELVGRLALEALEPAALELSLRAAEEMDREDERLETHWSRRLEQARYEVERARRQYDTAEPENRLVARELERRWEAALRAEQALAEDHARSRKDRPGPLSEADRRRLRALSSNMPALWATASAADRQEILRHLVERVEIGVTGESEDVEVKVRWIGGSMSIHAITRPVGTYERLREFPRLLERIRELQAAGHQSASVAATLNAEGFRSPRRDQKFTADRVRQVVSRYGLRERQPREAGKEIQPEADEAWMTDLAIELEIPIPTLTAWCRKGWVHARKVVTPEPRWLVWADAEERNRLRRLRAGSRSGLNSAYPAELKTPGQRPTSED
jgi:hypothetical protein